MFAVSMYSIGVPLHRDRQQTPECIVVILFLAFIFITMMASGLINATRGLTFNKFN